MVQYNRNIYFMLSYIAILSCEFVNLNLATCGEDVSEPELYCKLVGSSTSSLDPSEDINIIEGQVNIQYSFGKHF